MFVIVFTYKTPFEKFDPLTLHYTYTSNGFEGYGSIIRRKQARQSQER